MKLKETVTVNVLGANEGQISIFTNNIQELKITRVPGGFAVLLQVISGKYYTLADLTDPTIFVYETEQEAIDAKDAFVASLFIPADPNYIDGGDI